MSANCFEVLTKNVSIDVSALKTDFYPLTTCENKAIKMGLKNRKSDT